MPKIVFSSEQLPAHLDSRARFSQWLEMLDRMQYDRWDMSYLPDRPFLARGEVSVFGKLSVCDHEGTLSRATLTSRHIAAFKNDQQIAALMITRTPLVVSQHGRELEIGRGQMALSMRTAPTDVRPIPEPGLNNSFVTIAMPQARLSELVARAEDLIAAPIDATNAAAQHLRRYLGLLQEPDSFADDPSLVAHIETTLTDLIALALGAGRDGAQIARMRGLRAARTLEIIAEIRSGFADPACSPARVALKLGMSMRYLHELLQETGLSFGDRVLELRLQKARTMLASPRRDQPKVGEIALACGFNEISYFNRSFRRRFGASPTQYRGGKGAAG
jgi:AraC-like DNA-binding protein